MDTAYLAAVERAFLQRAGRAAARRKGNNDLNGLLREFLCKDCSTHYGETE